MRRICVFAGSSKGTRPEYAAAARTLGIELAGRGLELVYGGGNIGLMGIVADAVLDRGGRVTGVIPERLADLEVAHREVSDLRIVDTMHERKAVMAELSDGFIALPGGIGTLEELFEAVTWNVLHIHDKPCGLLNVGGYYDGLLQFLRHTVDERFFKAEYFDRLLAEPRADRLLDRFVRHGE